MSLLQMSFSGSILILVIVVIRSLVINKLPKKTFLALWSLALLRLILPLSLPSTFSVYSLVNDFNQMYSTLDNSSKGNVLSFIPVGNKTTISILPTVNQAQSSISFWTVIWIVGVMSCALLFTVVYSRCRREFRTSIPISNKYIEKWVQEHQILRTIEIRQSDRILAPLTYGIVHPVILVPKTVEWTNSVSLDYIFTHEYVHIRRFDTVVKLILILTVCIHWFNPIVWVMYILANRDVELSCDESVICLLGENTRSAYAMEIIHMAEAKNSLTPLCSNFSKNAIEERIVAIMKFRKSSWIFVATACVLVLTVGIIFSTSAKATQMDNNSSAVTYSTEDGKEDCERIKNQLNHLVDFSNERDAFFKQLQEEHMSGEISDEQFFLMSESLIKEQEQITEVIESLQMELKKRELK